MRIHKRQSASMNAKMDEIISDIGLRPDDEDRDARKALWIQEHLGDVEIDYPE